jgi:hypothetical protein
MNKELHTFNNGMTLNMSKVDGDKMHKTNSYVNPRYTLLNKHEPIEELMFEQILKNNDIKVYMNIGLFLGYYSILAKMMSPTTKVIGFERFDWLKPRIEENMKLNNVSDIDIVIGDVKEGGLKISDFVKEHDSIDLLSMDIQGEENYVMKELVDSGEIKKIKRFLIGSHITNNAHANCLNILKSNGYKIKFEGKPKSIWQQPDGIIWAEK